MSTQSIVVFCYDIVCPLAYIASRRIEGAVENVRSSCSHNVLLEWNPVLLGGLYDDSKAPQGKAGSSTDVVSKQKRKVLFEDILLQASRFNVELSSFHPRHPVKSLLCQRLLAVAPEQVRPLLTHDLYEAYWVKHEDIDDPNVLELYAKRYNIPISTIESNTAKDLLRKNTTLASSNGAFGVPSFLVYPKFTGIERPKPILFWGQDTIHFVEKMLGNTSAALPRCQPIMKYTNTRRKVKFYFDFSSPYAFLGYCHLQQLHNVADVELVPILLGAVFKSVGMAKLPMTLLSEAKRKYMERIFEEWLRWYGVKLRFPDTFPMNTVNALRIALVEPHAVDTLFRSAWQRNKDLGVPSVLVHVLKQSSFDGDALLEASKKTKIKEMLRSNTTNAISRGIFGVPTYEVFSEDESESQLLFGQDRVDTVMDIVCGWNGVGKGTKSKL